jgi:hypothetical protein
MTLDAANCLLERIDEFRRRLVCALGEIELDCRSITQRIGAI